MKVPVKFTIDLLRSMQNMTIANQTFNELFNDTEVVTLDIPVAITRKEWEQYCRDERIRLGLATCDINVSSRKRRA